MGTFYKLLMKLEPKENINILMYHGFTDGKASLGLGNYHGKHLEIHKFREQMAYLKDNYNVISLLQFIAGLAGKDHLPPRPVVITMDDGYHSNYTLAFPVLKEFQVPATIFVTTDFIDKKDFLWFDRIEYALDRTQKRELNIAIDGENLTFSLSTLPTKKEADRALKSKLKRFIPAQRNTVIVQIENQLREKLTFNHSAPSEYQPLEWPQVLEMMKSNLVTIGNHTSTHTILTVLNAQDVRTDLENAKKRIEAMTQKENVFFSYPNGGAGDFNAGTKTLLQEMGFRCALTTIVEANIKGCDVFELKRLNVHNEGGFYGFLRTMSSFWRFLRKVKNASVLGE